MNHAVPAIGLFLPLVMRRAMTITRLLTLVAVSTAFACSGSRSPGGSPTVTGPRTAVSRDRAEFGKRLARVQVGMPAREVEKILGKPDDIRTQDDPGGISTTRTKEIWCYGTDGHLTFPTLGQVYLDVDGGSQYIYGGKGEPPAPSLFTEEELSNLLRVIDRSPGTSGWTYNPLRIIEAVNVLQPLGKEKALAAIDEYIRISSWFHSEALQGGLFLVLRVLFELPEGSGDMPPMILGASCPGESNRAAGFPRFPVYLEDDIPLLMIFGYELAGVPEPVQRHVEFFRKNGKIRAKPLSPGPQPMAVVERLEKSPDWIYARKEQYPGQAMIANQVLRLVSSVYRPPPGKHQTGAYPGWQNIAEAFSKLEARWDSRRNRYTLRDGTTLPDPEVRRYSRKTWTMDPPGLRAKLILERRDENEVRLDVESTGEDPSKARPCSVRVFNVREKDRTLVTVELDWFTGWKGQGRTLTLTTGEEVQGELMYDGVKTLSPTFKP